MPMKSEHNKETLVELVHKPDFDLCMERVNAWYACEIVDRAPVRFSAHNAEYSENHGLDKKHNSYREQWFDTEYQVETFVRSIEGRSFIAETFPVFWPNLGPELYSAFYGGDMEYKAVTSYYQPIIRDWSEMDEVSFSADNPFWKKLEEITDYALDRCEGKYLVGYTDLHPGLDCAAAWRDPQQFCMDLLLYPEESKKLLELATRDFVKIFDYWDKKLKDHGHLSVTWMGIPSYGKMHIPGADFSSLISPQQYEEFGFPILQKEVQTMTHNIFHMDGSGVAKNLDLFLQVPEINAIQWVQGVGDDEPIMQWVPLIRKIQAAGKGLVIDLKVEELEPFMDAVRPEGIFLCISADEDVQPDILKKIEGWR
jgi:hypothetical protein